MPPESDPTPPPPDVTQPGQGGDPGGTDGGDPGTSNPAGADPEGTQDIIDAIDRLGDRTGQQMDELIGEDVPDPGDFSDDWSDWFSSSGQGAGEAFLDSMPEAPDPGGIFGFVFDWLPETGNQCMSFEFEFKSTVFKLPGDFACYYIDNYIKPFLVWVFFVFTLFTVAWLVMWALNFGGN